MTRQIFLNHMCRPNLSVMQLVALSEALGMQGVELRNDIGRGDPLTGIEPAAIVEYAASLKQEILTINALQRANDGARTPQLSTELTGLARTAVAIEASGIVLCPVNTFEDSRSETECLKDLISNLKAFGPILEDHGIIGLVEPLGFPQSSLRSQKTALEAIAEVGSNAFRLLLDTFHFALGPDSFDDLAHYPIEQIGLVHMSGVEVDIPSTEMLDDHRVLVTPDDRLETVRQLKTLSERSYTRAVAFESFSSMVHMLSDEKFSRSVKKSLDYLSKQEI